MKKGQEIPVDWAVTRPAQRMAWTEEQTGERTTTAPEIFYHKSSSPIRAFAPGTICTFNDKRGGDGYVYEITVPAGTVIFEYNVESRFELTSRCRVRYIGRRFYRYGKNWRPGQSPTLIDNTL
jgi:hypothetical protein